MSRHGSRYLIPRGHPIPVSMETGDARAEDPSPFDIARSWSDNLRELSFVFRRRKIVRTIKGKDFTLRICGPRMFAQSSLPGFVNVVSEMKNIVDIVLAGCISVGIKVAVGIIAARIHGEANA